ncbi:MAG: nuclear transport factor 2 family protein [Fimbriimonadaceae bacterium]
MIHSRPHQLLTAITLICLPIFTGCTDLRSFELQQPITKETSHDNTQNEQPSHRQPKQTETNISQSIEAPKPNPLLDEWTERYVAYTKTITDLDYKTWQAYIAPSFVWTKSDGTKVNRADALKEFGAIFQAKTITGTEKVLKVTESGGLVNVELHVDLTMDFPETGESKYVADGTDVWKQFDGKWLMVKSIDKPEAEQEPKSETPTS